MPENDNVAIIGAGPVGSCTAYELAKRGVDVSLYEEHKQVGRPVQCAGLLSPRIFALTDIKGLERSVLNDCKGADIFSPSGQKVTIKAKDVKARVVDRSVFDNIIADAAVDMGANLHMRTKVLSCTKADDSIKFSITAKGGEKTRRARVLVGACGPRSGLLEGLGTTKPKFLFAGFQAEVEGIEPAMDMVQLYKDQRYAPGFFAWVIPVEKGLVRIGLGAYNPDTSPKQLLDKFYQNKVFLDWNGLSDPKELKVIDNNAGTIPLGVADKIVADNFLMVGDAAGMCKPPSGGGVFTGLKAATIAAETIAEGLEKDDLSASFLKRYPKKFKADLGKELKRSLIMRKVYMGFTNRQLEELFDILQDPEILNLIETQGDIDYPYALALKLVKKAPALGKFFGPMLGAFLM